VKPRGSLLQCERGSNKVCRFPYKLAGATTWRCVERDGTPVCPVADPTENNRMMEYADTTSQDFKPCGMCQDGCMMATEFNGLALTNHAGMNTYKGVTKDECQKLCGVAEGCNFFNFHTKSLRCFLKFGVGRIKRGASTNFNEVFGPKTCPVSCGSETAASCAKCPVASGDTWCRGDCQLQRGTCKAKRDLVSGTWMSWSSWGACSHLDGQQRQTRKCSHPLGRSCTGSEEKSKDCAVAGGWSDWGKWDTCNKDGLFEQRRHRTCTKPTPLNGGADCAGEPTEKQSCTIPVSEPKIFRLHVNTTISLRYASTEVESLMMNPDKNPQELTFEINLPEDAFVHKFSMMVDGKAYEAKVENKADANQQYADAKKRGIEAGLVSRENEGTAVFSVNTTVPAGKEVLFKLTYQEELQREEESYTYHVNLGTEKEVDDLKIEVHINETLPLLSCSWKRLVGGVPNRKAVTKQDDEDNGLCSFLYRPNKQQQIAARKKNRGGQFAVEYEVDMDEVNGEILAFNGFFAHMFQDPPGYEPLPKYTIFILDVSGSMAWDAGFGQALEQVQEAMYQIIDENQHTDYFSFIKFSSGVEVWSTSNSVRGLPTDPSTGPWDIFAANGKNKRAAEDYVASLVPGGCTNILGALERGLDLAEETKKKGLRGNGMTAQIMFLTDGHSCYNNMETIRRKVRQKNINNVPIFTLAFSRNADFKGLRNIAKDSGAKSKLIYHDGDAAHQLRNFFETISSPIMKNLKFTYDGINVDDQKLIHSGQQRMEMGSSTMNVAQYPVGTGSITVTVNAVMKDTNIQTEVEVPTTAGSNKYQDFLQRLYAHSTIKKILNKAKDNGDKLSDEDALQVVQLAKKYNFVTPLTSLVVTSDKRYLIEVPTESIGVDGSHALGESTEADDDAEQEECREESTLTLFSRQVLDGTSHQVIEPVEQIIEHTNQTTPNTGLNLADFNFDKKAASLTVSGSNDTCWMVFRDENITGKWAMFGPGNYSMFGLGVFFEDISSVWCIRCPRADHM